MRRLFVLLALGILWAGCGGGDDDAELVSRLPGDARALGVIDLAVVKERLGLPEDADPTRPPPDRRVGARTRLFAYAADAFPYLARFDRTFMQAIDESRVTQAATTQVSGPDTLVVLATDQPFDDEIAKRLERAGYRARNGLLVSEGPGRPGDFEAVGGEDGLVVLAADEQAARRALEGDQPDGPTRELLNETDAPVRGASTLGGGDSCLQGIAFGDEIDPPELEVVMKVEGEASTDRVEDPSADTSGPFEPGDAEADGDIARLPLTYRPFPGPTPIRVLTVTLFQPYRCSGD